MPILSGADLILHGVEELKGKINPDLEEDLNSNIELIIRNASKLLRLSEDILQVSRIESGTFRLKLEPVNLEQLVQNSISDVKKRYSGVKLDINIELESNLATLEGKNVIFCDPTKVSQTLFNLIDNAMKFTEQGEISISADRNDSEIIIEVLDSGSGISPEIKERLFEKFASK